MKSKSCFIILALILIFSLVSCAPAPVPAPKSEPMPTPTQPPAQTPTLKPPPVAIPPSIPPIGKPSLSEEEMAVKLWAMLPEGLPDGFLKSQFNPKMRKAIYQGNGKWQFEVVGYGSESTSLPLRNYEKTPGNWVENHSREVTTYKLVLTANYYEKTGTLDILSIQKLDEKTSVETISEMPIIGEGLKIVWITGASIGGYGLRVEGSVKNIGCVPLENVIIEVKTFDVGGNWVRTDNITLSPSKINVGERGRFLLQIQQKLIGAKTGEHGEYILGRYSYRFILSSGEELYFERSE